MAEKNLLVRTSFHAIVFFHIWLEFFRSTSAIFNLSDEVTGKYERIYVLKQYQHRYFTVWSFTFHAVFATLCVAHDILEWFKKDDTAYGKIIKYLIDVMYYSVFVFAVGTTVTFWTIHTIDSSIVSPTIYTEVGVLTSWRNHTLHTFGPFLMLLETILTPRRRHRDEEIENFIFVFVPLVYTVVLFGSYLLDGVFIYKTPHLAGLVGVSVFANTIITIYSKVIYPLNRLIHSEEEKGDITKNIEEDIVSNGINGNNNVDSNGVPIGLHENLMKEIKEKGGKELIIQEESLNGYKKPQEFEGAWGEKYRSLREKFERQ